MVSPSTCTFSNSSSTDQQQQLLLPTKFGGDFARLLAKRKGDDVESNDDDHHSSFSKTTTLLQRLLKLEASDNDRNDLDNDGHNFQFHNQQHRQERQQQHLSIMSARTKAGLVDWILELVCVFELSRDVLGDAVTLLYRSSHLFMEQHRQQHAAVCVHMASMLHNNNNSPTTSKNANTISIGDIAMACDRMSSTQINVMSQITTEAVYQQLSELISDECIRDQAFLTIFHFTDALGELAQIPSGSPTQQLLHFFSEKVLYLGLPDADSKVGFSVTVLTLLLSGLFADPWSSISNLLSVSPYSWETIEECIISICRHLRELEARCPELKIVEQRYHARVRGFGRIPNEVEMILLLRNRRTPVNAILD